MSRKGQSITLSVSEQDKQFLESLAVELGYTWGDKANISKLITAIARKELTIAINNDWTKPRTESLEQARKLLFDLGYVEHSREIARLLLDRRETTIPQQIQLQQFLDSASPLWRTNIDRWIKQQQPFRLTYYDVADREWHFTILHATFHILEKHQYLVCTCEESEGNQDIPELKHNWVLRLDRIQEALVNPVQLPWQKDLDQVTVKFRVYGNLAFNYDKQDNSIIGEIEGEPPQRTITTEIYSTFWFFRRIATYWNNCEIISPDPVREYFKRKVQALYEKYQNPS
jgi:predicted DNA-binding transcriptional regulator YafY